MDDLFMILTLVSIFWLILGLIKPSLFNKFFKEKANRTSLSLFFVLSIVGSFIWFWVISPSYEEKTIVWESTPIVEVNPMAKEIKNVIKEDDLEPAVKENNLALEEVEIEAQNNIEEIETKPVEIEPVVEEIKPPVKNIEPSIIDYEILREWNPDSDGQWLGVEILISKDDATKANIVALVESLSKSHIKKAVVKIYQSKEARNEEQLGSYSFTDVYRKDYLAYYIKDITNDIKFEWQNEIRWKQDEWKLQDLSWTRTEIK